MLDARVLDPMARYRAAEAVRQAHDITSWPQIPGWNDRACRRHQQMGAGAPLTVESAVTLPRCECGKSGLPHVCPLCRQCGVVLRRHQRVGAAWLYFAGKGLLADSVGLGKTAQITAVLAMCRAAGELGVHARTIVLCKPAAIGQWRDELRRMLPGIAVITADGTPTERTRNYLLPWEVCVMSPMTLADARGPKTSRAGDLQQLEHFPLGMVVYDDCDAMRNPTNRQAYAINKLSANIPRVIGVHATSLQKQLLELHSFLAPVGGVVVFGTRGQFKHHYVTSEKVWYTKKDKFGRKVATTREKATGIKNEAELRSLLAPLVLRRRAQDLDDISIPAVVPSLVWLDPLPEQARAYEELREGVLRKLNEDGDTIDMVQAKAVWMHGWQVCSGLATQGHDVSVKLNWVMDALTGDLAEDKVVVFINFKPNVEALSRRLDEQGIGHVVMWGQETGRALRDERLRQFREDPDCKVLIGTTTIEASLNLQVARHLIAVDTIANPARMTQIVGRIARAGSAHQTVYLHQLLMRGTQEEHLPSQLAEEQAMADTVWDERSDLFRTASPRDVLRMITERARVA